MWNQRKHTRTKTSPDPQSSLNGLMNAVDSYITELNDQQQQQLPIRSHSLQQQGSRPPLSSQRANTTQNYPVSLSLPIIMYHILIIHYETKKKKKKKYNLHQHSNQWDVLFE
jgi:hypothetical protein